MVSDVVLKYKANKHSKGFPVWSQLMCMLFCHFSNAQSIRDIVHGMCSTTGNLHHIDVRRLPKRSTLSYANKHRDWRVFRDIYFALFNKLNCHLEGRRTSFSIKSKIYLLDSSIIQLSLKVFEWATYRQHKGAMKIHTLLEYQGAMPTYIHITDAKQHDVIHAWEMKLPKGCVIVADRAYFDFGLLYDWDKRQQVKYVVRAKKRFYYQVIKNNPTDSENILKDQIIKLTGPSGAKKYPHQVRRVEVYDPVNHKTIILLTNATSSWTAETISQLYKARWDIELFFKDIKQHLKIKSFVGTSMNAILTQIWTAMITLLILKYLKARAAFQWHLSNLVSFLRFNLLVAVDLYSWLDRPIFILTRGSPQHEQLSFFTN
jgi:hypothetical protein